MALQLGSKSRRITSKDQDAVLVPQRKIPRITGLIEGIMMVFLDTVSDSGSHMLLETAE